MSRYFLLSLLVAYSYTLSLTCVINQNSAPLPTPIFNPLPTPIFNPDPIPQQPTDLEIESRYPTGGSCESGGSYSVNEFGASICEYQANSCPTTKYFVYAEGGSGVELCCSSNSACNYDPVKNYCHPDLRRCVDGEYFGCSEKAGPIFDRCL